MNNLTKYAAMLGLVLGWFLLWLRQERAGICHTCSNRVPEVPC